MPDGALTGYLVDDKFSQFIFVCLFLFHVRSRLPQMVDFMHISNLLDALVVLDLLHGDLKTSANKRSCH